MPLTRSRTSNTTEVAPRRVLGNLDNTSPSRKVLGNLDNTPPVKAQKSVNRGVSKEKCIRLVGREEEMACIETVITESAKEGKSGSLYISGAPGTGKTAVVRHVCLELLPTGCRFSYVNCMRVSNPSSLADAILRELKGARNTLDNSQNTLEMVEKYLSRQSDKKALILVLDEMDVLAHSHQETLYRLFDWPGVLPCRLILICIANSLDLTDRLLPRLKGRTWRPTLLHFKPYTHEELANIVKSKLDSPKPESSPITIDSMAVQLCARKVAASSGDARAALDICRRSVQLAGESPASLAHVSRAMSSRSSNPLPLQHKLALAAALLIQRREFSLGLFHDRYQGLCRERQLTCVDAGEFAAMCQLLEARGLIHVRKAKETRMHKISVKLDDKSVRQTIDDPALISSVLAARDRQEAAMRY